MCFFWQPELAHKPLARSLTSFTVIGSAGSPHWRTICWEKGHEEPSLRSRTLDPDGGSTRGEALAALICARPTKDGTVDRWQPTVKFEMRQPDKARPCYLFRPPAGEMSSDLPAMGEGGTAAGTPAAIA